MLWKIVWHRPVANKTKASLLMASVSDACLLEVWLGSRPLAACFMRCSSWLPISTMLENHTHRTEFDCEETVGVNLREPIRLHYFTIQSKEAALSFHATLILLKGQDTHQIKVSNESLNSTSSLAVWKRNVSGTQQFSANVLSNAEWKQCR